MSRIERFNRTTLLGRRQILQGSLVAVAAGMGPARAASAAGGEADLVIRNGRVLVLDEGFQTAEAIAVGKGRILAVGTDQEVRSFITSRTRELDAQGGTVLPGINDTHLHLNGVGLSRPPHMIDVNKASIEELVAEVRTAAQQAGSADSWIRGNGWQELRIPRAPTAADLDAVSGDHPVVLRDFSQHALAVNSVVLRRAGITRDTAAPVGGVIDRHPDGEPTGVLRETAMGLVQQLVPAFTADELSDAIDYAVQLSHSQGITSATEPGINLETFQVYASKARNGELPMRISALLRPGGRSPAGVRQTLSEFRHPTDIDPRILHATGFKLGADGIPRFRTAWMNQPYLDGTRGALTVDGDTIEEQVANLHQMIELVADAGFQVGTHSCGDAATDAVVEGYVKAQEKAGSPAELRHCVHHCNFPSDATLRKWPGHDIGANLNAEILYLQGRVLEPIIGRELTEYQWPYRSALDAGVQVTSGSDAPVVDGNFWLQGVMAAVNRKGRDGSIAGEAERISVAEALATYTRTSAWQDRAESWKGTLEPGKVADICIVDGDLLSADPGSFADMRINATVLGGDVVYERPSSDLRQSASAAAALSSRSCLHGDMCCCKAVEQLNT